jgi:hypothetical protein
MQGASRNRVPLPSGSPPSHHRENLQRPSDDRRGERSGSFLPLWEQ